MSDRYYLKADHQTEWDEVSREQFIAAEQAAGFRSKFGPSHPATGGFSGRGMAGRVEYVTTKEQPMSDTLLEVVRIAISDKERDADQLDQWAIQSERGGWSTHQVEPMRKQADRLRREASQLRQDLNRATKEVDVV